MAHISRFYAYRSLPWQTTRCWSLRLCKEHPMDFQRAVQMIHFMFPSDSSLACASLEISPTFGGLLLQLSSWPLTAAPSLLVARCQPVARCPAAARCPLAQPLAANRPPAARQPPTQIRRSVQEEKVKTCGQASPPSGQPPGPPPEGGPTRRSHKNLKSAMCPPRWQT